ncbi:MAG: AMP-binding protein [Xylophilus ampelinus]
MSAVLSAAAPAAGGLVDERRTWSADALRAESGALEARWRAAGVRVLATLMDNGAAWVVADRAALAAGIVHVPVPLFFTPAQIAAALGAAGVDAVLAAPAAAAHWPGLPQEPCRVADQDLVLLRLPAAPVAMPPGTAKITFTSGSTGTPKGVCLTADAMEAVADGLRQALAPLGIRRHLCALPFAVLLENIAGLAAPLGQGADCVALPLAQVGLQGSSQFDPGRFDAAVRRHRPDSVILLPQMLRAWTAWLAHAGMRAPEGLRLAAVGGAAVGARLLRAARAAGIPAYEGYGLSEGASVQALNLPGADRPGSAGRPLPHARLRIGSDGGIEVAGSLFAGYLGADGPAAGVRDGWLATGDLGRLDADGFLHVDGRRSNLLVTGFGRNVSPEWVETALRSAPAVAQAAVFGDGQPALGAVLWPSRPELPEAQAQAALQAAVDAANAELPDYARIGRWLCGRAAFDAASGMATANGRPRRDAILRAHPDLFAPAAAAAPAGFLPSSQDTQDTP